MMKNDGRRKERERKGVGGCWGGKKYRVQEGAGDIRVGQNGI